MESVKESLFLNALYSVPLDSSLHMFIETLKFFSLLNQCHYERMNPIPF